MRPDLRALVRDIRQRLGRHSLLLLGAIVLSGLTEGLSLALLVPLLPLVGIGDAGSPDRISLLVRRFLEYLRFEPNLLAVGALVLAALALQMAVFLTQSWLAASVQNDYAARWRDDLFAAFMRARWPFFVGHKSGVLVNALIGETNRLSGAVYLVIQLAAGVVVTFVYAGLALLVSWPIAVGLLLLGAVLFTATRGLLRRSYEIGVEISGAGDTIQTLAGEFLGGAKVVKATATEEAAGSRFHAVVDDLRRLYFWSSYVPNVTRSIFETCAVAGLVAALIVGTAWLQIGPARILVVLALFVRLYPRLTGLQQNFQQLNLYLPSIATVGRLLAEAEQAREPLTATPLPAGVDCGPVSIEVRGLAVRYGARRVLDGIDLVLPQGATVGIVGSSGAGKSTLVDCLLRLVEPAEGLILVNGTLLRDLPLAQWRRRVGYVAQETFLFHASVRDNIAWAVPAGTDADEVVDAAARAACVDEFVAAMPEGYATMVGDRGVRLSGGQRQRLGLARALVGRPSLLILDEATSALDSESEREVMEAIRRLRGETTIVIVAHRLSTVRDCDAIHVLEGGAIVETGTWTELLARDARFKALWALQSSDRAS
jgi:ATP-binding cassette subfamily C protein